MKARDRNISNGGGPLSDSQGMLCGLVAHGLFGVPCQIAEDVDWAAMLRESNMQGVHLIAFRHSKHYAIPQEQMAKIKSVLIKYMMRDTRLQAAHSDLHRVLTEGGIPYTIIKGAASARYYPAPGLRSMGDVDFYVDRERIDQATALLTQHGYTVRDIDNDHHVVMDKGNVRFEMHFEPVGLPEGRGRDEVLGYFATMTEDAEFVSNGITACVCPSAFHHGLILLMHTQHHMLSEGIGLRHLCDWAVFVNHFAENEFAALFEEPLKRMGLWSFARYLSLACARHLGVTRRAWMGETMEDDRIADAVIADVLAGGNFGIKDHQRRYEGAFIANREQEGKKTNRVVEGIRYMNRVTRQKMPVTQKVPLLLPIGWIWVLIGFAGRNRKRKKEGRRVNAVKAFQDSSARMKLYEKLRIYQPEDGQGRT